jgi:hypothetical protein
VRAGPPVRADLSPDGKQLAIALGSGNRVALVDVDRLGGPEAEAVELALAPDMRAPVIVDLVFAHDGQTLWVLTGDTARSQPLGPQPTRVFAVRIGLAVGGRRTLESARTVTVARAEKPARLATSRSLPLASGAAVRLPPEKATVYLAAARAGSSADARAAVFAIGPEDAAVELMLASGTTRLEALDVTPEGRWLVAVAVATGGAVEVLATPAEAREATPRAVNVGAASGSGATELRIQP